MDATYRTDVFRLEEDDWLRSPGADHLIDPGIDAVRESRLEPFLKWRPTLSGASVKWGAIAGLIDYATPVLCRVHGVDGAFVAGG